MKVIDRETEIDEYEVDITDDEINADIVHLRAAGILDAIDEDPIDIASAVIFGRRRYPGASVGEVFLRDALDVARATDPTKLSPETRREFESHVEYLEAALLRMVAQA